MSCSADEIFPVFSVILHGANVILLVLWNHMVY